MGNLRLALIPLQKKKANYVREASMTILKCLRRRDPTEPKSIFQYEPASRTRRRSTRTAGLLPMAASLLVLAAGFLTAAEALAEQPKLVVFITI